MPTRLSCVQGPLCLQQPLPEGPAVKGGLAGPERAGPAACVLPRVSAPILDWLWAALWSALGLAGHCRASPVAPRARLARPPRRCNSHICLDLLVQSKAWCVGNCRRKTTALLVPLSSAATPGLLSAQDSQICAHWARDRAGMRWVGQ